MGRKPIATYEITALLERSHMLSASEIQEQLSLASSPLNKTTIYRTLEKLLSSGQICRHSLGGDTLLYELRFHHHDHFVCESCGKIDTIECSIPESKALSEFKVTHHHVTLFGICQSCTSTLRKN